MIVPFLPLAAILASPLTLDEAVNRAVSHDSTLASLAAQTEGAEAGASALRANYGPKLRLEGNVIVWDSAQTVSFASGGGAGFPALPAPTTPYEQAVAGIVQALGGLGKPTTVRDQVTAQATVQIIQPLLGLIAVNQAADVADLNVTATRQQATSRRHRVEIDTITGYFRTLQAQALGRAAAQQVESLEAQQKKVESLYANGVLGKNDVLKLQVAVAAARQQSLNVQGMVQQAQAALAMQVGAAPGESFELTSEAPALDAAPVPDLGRARDAAKSDRPEIVELNTRLRQSQEAIHVAKAKLLPDLNLIGQYQHSEGSTFSAADSFFGGLFLTWTAWEWGATAKQVAVAQSQEDATRALLNQAEKGVGLEAEAAHVQLKTADSAVPVAEGAIAQAEEALRLERARLDAQQATTTDVINAETALLQARVNLENARYERLIARARLRAAMGQPVLDASRSGVNP